MFCDQTFLDDTVRLTDQIVIWSHCEAVWFCGQWQNIYALTVKNLCEILSSLSIDWERNAFKLSHSSRSQMLPYQIVDDASAAFILGGLS